MMGIPSAVRVSRLGPGLALASAFVLGGCASGPSRPLAELTVAEWTEDVRFVIGRLTSEHPALYSYHGVEPARFQAAADNLERDLPGLGPAEIALRLDEWVAMVGDGHTSLDAVQSRAQLARYPLRLAYFGDELRVYAAPPALREALGAEVLSIDGVGVGEAAGRIAVFVSRDNDEELRWMTPTYLVTAAALAHAGIARSADRATFGLRRDGVVDSLVLEPWPLDTLTASDWLSAPDATGAATPLYLTRSDERYWLEPLDGGRVVYVKWNRIDDAQDGPDLRSFYRSLFERIDADRSDRLVVDLRHNSGGNFLKARAFLDGVLSRPALTRPGGTIVLTGTQTFSAATHVAARLRFEAGATIMGEVSRANPNFAYNSEVAVLPRSGLRMEYTDRLHEQPPFPQLGALRHLPVDVPVVRTFEDYVSGRDRVLEQALAWQPRE